MTIIEILAREDGSHNIPPRRRQGVGGWLHRGALPPGGRRVGDLWLV